MSAKDSKKSGKFIAVTYLSDGQVEVESNGITVFDLWSLSAYLKMRADEMYITTQTKNRMEEAARNPMNQLEIPGKGINILDRRQGN